MKFCKWQQVSFIALCVGEKINTSIDELVLKLTGKNKYSYFNTSLSITGILVLKQRLFYCVSHESVKKTACFWTWLSDLYIFFRCIRYWRKVTNCFNLYFVFLILQVRQANHLFPWWSTPKHDPRWWRWFDWPCSQRTSRFARRHQGKLI